MASTSVSTLPHAPPSPPSRPAADLLAPISRRRPGPGRRRRRPCAHVQRTARQQGPSCNEPLSQPPRSRHAHALGGFPCRGGTYVLAEPTGRGPLPLSAPPQGPRGAIARPCCCRRFTRCSRASTHTDGIDGWLVMPRPASTRAGRAGAVWITVRGLVYSFARGGAVAFPCSRFFAATSCRCCTVMLPRPGSIYPRCWDIWPSGRACAWVRFVCAPARPQR